MIEIVCNIDRAYVKHCRLMLCTLLSSNRAVGAFRVHIITTGMSAADEAELASLSQLFDVKVCFYAVDYNLISSFPIREQDHLSLATYLRIYMPRLLPADIDKVLYLDSDIIVIDSIDELWNTPLGDYALAAVEERPPHDVETPRRLGYPEEWSYFNAGVLLVNLKLWRQLDVTSRCHDIIAEKGALLLHHDQDVLNTLLGGNKMLLSARWNMMDFFLLCEPDVQPRRMDDIRQSLTCPAIIHYNHLRKPWMHNCDNPLRWLYIDAALRHQPSAAPLRERVHYFFRNLLYRILGKRSAYLTEAEMRRLIRR